MRLLTEGDKIYLGQAILPVLNFSPVIIILPTLHFYAFISLRHWIIEQLTVSLKKTLKRKNFKACGTRKVEVK
jgi:hypothetical protein